MTFALRESVHDVPPVGVHTAIGKRRLNELLVVEPEKAFMGDGTDYFSSSDTLSVFF